MSSPSKPQAQGVGGPEAAELRPLSACDMSSSHFSPVRNGLGHSLGHDLEMLRFAAFNAERAADVFLESFGNRNWIRREAKTDHEWPSSGSHETRNSENTPTSPGPIIGSTDPQIYEQRSRAGLPGSWRKNDMQAVSSTMYVTHSPIHETLAQRSPQLESEEKSQNTNTIQEIAKWRHWQPIRKSGFSQRKNDSKDAYIPGEALIQPSDATRRGFEPFSEPNLEALVQSQNQQLGPSASPPAQNFNFQNLVTATKPLLGRPASTIQMGSTLQTNAKSLAKKLDSPFRANRRPVNSQHGSTPPLLDSLYKKAAPFESNMLNIILSEIQKWLTDRTNPHFEGFRTDLFSLVERTCQAFSRSWKLDPTYTRVIIHGKTDAHNIASEVTFLELVKDECRVIQQALVTEILNTFRNEDEASRALKRLTDAFTYVLRAWENSFILKANEWEKRQVENELMRIEKPAYARADTSLLRPGETLGPYGKLPSEIGGSYDGVPTIRDNLKKIEVAGKFVKARELGIGPYKEYPDLQPSSFENQAHSLQPEPNEVVPHSHDQKSRSLAGVERTRFQAGVVQSDPLQTTSNASSLQKFSALQSRRSVSAGSGFSNVRATKNVDTSNLADPLVKLNGRSGHPQDCILMHHVPAPSVTGFDRLLSQRELGVGRRNGGAISAHGVAYQLRNYVADRLTDWTSWTGVSKDVLTVSWSPDGSRYGVGGSTDMDALNIQYNRCNNLLLGDLDTQTLTELPDHHIPRPKPEEIETGDNSRQAVYDSVDPLLYTTVPSLCFEETGSWMFTASYDKTVKVWDITTSNAVCVQTLRHSANVDHVVLDRFSSAIATGQREIEDPVQIFGLDPVESDNGANPVILHSSFSSQRAGKFKLHPSSLRWGIHPAVNHLLLAGFSEDGENERPIDGDLCVWNATSQTFLKVRPSSQSVFDTCWHPTLPLFAAATSLGRGPTNLTHRSFKSVIRTWQPLETSSRVMEYECPAYDINVLTFNPRAENYITAGCTDGNIYVWDYRMPNEILHKLAHDRPIDEQDSNRSRQDQDTGVCFSAWDQDGRNLYTGSSDGKIKAWSIYGSTEDALVRDVAAFDAGIMCGEFSPSYDKLLLGLSKGSIQILSTTDLTPQGADDDGDPWSDHSDRPLETITYIPAKRPRAFGEEVSGVGVSRELLDSGKLVMHPIYGVGKGPNYDGPYAAYARPEGSDPHTTELLPDIRATHLDSQQRLRALREGGRASEVDRKKYENEARLARARNYERYGIREQVTIEKRHWKEDDVVEIGDDGDNIPLGAKSQEGAGPSKPPRPEKTSIVKGKGTAENPMVLDDDDEEDLKDHATKAAALLTKFTRVPPQPTTRTTRQSSQRNTKETEPQKTRQSTRNKPDHPSSLTPFRQYARKSASKVTKIKSPVNGRRRSGRNSGNGQDPEPEVEEEEVEEDEEEEEPGSPLVEVDWF